MTNKSVAGKEEGPSDSSQPLTMTDLVRVLGDMFNIPAPALREHIQFILDDGAPSSPTDFDSDDDDIVVVLADPANPSKSTKTTGSPAAASSSGSATSHHATVAGTSITVSVKSKTNGAPVAAATSTPRVTRTPPRTPSRVSTLATLTTAGNSSIGAAAPVAVAASGAPPITSGTVTGRPALVSPVANPGVAGIAEAGVPLHAHLVQGNWCFAAPLYPIDPFSPGTPGPFYAVTIGTRTGVFSPWGNAAPYCQGIPGGTVAGYATQNQARAAYNSALVNGCVRIVEIN